MLPATGQFDDGREGPLNWRQTEWFMYLPPEAVEGGTTSGATRVSGRDLPVPVILDVLRSLIGRHEALRTLVENPGSAAGRQRVASPGIAASELESRVAVVDERRAEEAIEAARRPFRPAEEWPVRVVISERNGRAKDILVATDHSAVDAWGMRVLRKDLESLLEADGSRHPARRPGIQPLDLALWERSSAGERQEALAEEFYVGQLSRLRDGIDFAGQPRTHDDDGTTPRRHGTARLISATLRHRVDELSRRLGVPAPVVCLVAFGDVICRLGGSDTMAALVMLANRWIRHTFRSVCYMATTVPVVFADVSGRATIDIAVDCAGQLAVAQRAAHMDPLRRSDIWHSMLPPDKSEGVACSFFNWLGPTLTEHDSEPGPGERADEPDEPVEEIEFGPTTDKYGGMLALSVEPRGSTLRFGLSWCVNSRWGPVGAQVLGEVANSLVAMHEKHR